MSNTDSIHSMISTSLNKHGFCKVHIRDSVLMISAYRDAGMPEPVVLFQWRGNYIPADKAEHLLRTRFMSVVQSQHVRENWAEYVVKCNNDTKPVYQGPCHTIFTWFSDSGHEWLQVPVAMLHGLGIYNSITSYSYMGATGRLAYLEGDCDASTFLDAYRAAKPDLKLEFIDHHVDGDCFVRKLPRFQRIINTRMEVREGGYWDEGYDCYDDDRSEFEHPHGNSALRASSKSNPRNLPCPTCKRPNMLTPKDRALGYQCDYCADACERGGEY